MTPSARCACCGSDQLVRGEVNLSSLAGPQGSLAFYHDSAGVFDGPAYLAAMACTRCGAVQWFANVPSLLRSLGREVPEGPPEETVTGEATPCLQCGGMMDGAATRCDKCGWTFAQECDPPAAGQ